MSPKIFQLGNNQKKKRKLVSKTKKIFQKKMTDTPAKPKKYYWVMTNEVFEKNKRKRFV